MKKIIPVISLCGIDGVGKTSIFKKLETEPELKGKVYFVGRGPAIAESTVEKCFPRKNGIEDWYSGEFNQAIAISCAIDYVNYYNQVIRPVLEGSSTQYKLVVTDRHTPCFKAFTLINEQPSNISLQILDSVPAPEKVLFITLKEELIRQRMDSSSDDIHEFETKECQKKLLAAYVNLFESSDLDVESVSNDGSFEQTLNQVKSIITSYL
jgi:thymidylate kinase